MELPRLRELRQEKFLTQRALAQQADVTESTVNRLEQRLQVARYSTILKLAAALGVEPGELVRKIIDG